MTPRTRCPIPPPRRPAECEACLAWDGECLVLRDPDRGERLAVIEEYLEPLEAVEETR